MHIIMLTPGGMTYYFYLFFFILTIILMLHNAQYCIDGNVDLSLYGIPALWTDSQRIFSREYFAILITIGVIFRHIMHIDKPTALSYCPCRIDLPF